jgi:hypothetical protein
LQFAAPAQADKTAARGNRTAVRQATAKRNKPLLARYDQSKSRRNGV